MAITEARQISNYDAIYRLDLNYHKFLEFDLALRKGSKIVTLKELGAEIVRGSRSKKEFINLGLMHFHTSDFPSTGVEIAFDYQPNTDFQLAREGDILLPRVGTRCLGRQALVTNGCRPYTEAVFRLRIASKYHKKVFGWINSDVGTLWRQTLAKGSCAKHLTVSSLLNMPIPI